MYSKPVIFVVILVSVVAVTYAPSAIFHVFGKEVSRGPIGCKYTGTATATCCQFEYVFDTEAGSFSEAMQVEQYCTDCDVRPSGQDGMYNCGERELQYRPAPLTKDLPLSPQPFEQAPQVTPPFPSGEVIQELSEPASPQTGEIAPQVVPPTTDEGAETPAPPATPQIGETAPQVVPPIAEEGIQETSPEPLPPCPDGQVLDEETGICVPVESPPAEQPEEAAEPQPEGEPQQSEEGDNSEENGGS